MVSVVVGLQSSFSLMHDAPGKGLLRWCWVGFRVWAL